MFTNIKRASRYYKDAQEPQIKHILFKKYNQIDSVIRKNFIPEDLVLSHTKIGDFR
jgi:hypothetical protein